MVGTVWLHAYLISHVSNRGNSLLQFRVSASFYLNAGLLDGLWIEVIRAFNRLARKIINLIVDRCMGGSTNKQRSS